MERDLEEMVRDNPSSRLFAPLADSYRKTGRLEQAVHTLLKGLTFHPSYISARVLLARCYGDLGEWSKAREEWRKILELDPGNLVALRGAAEASLRLGMIEDARIWYGAYLDEIPDDPEVRERLRVIEEDIGKREVREGPKKGSKASAAEAIRVGEIERGESTKPQGPSESSESLASVDRSSVEEEYEGEESVETMTLAEVYAQQGFFERAIEIYRKILALDPSNDRIRERIGELEGKLGQIPNADSASAVIEAEYRLKPDFLRQRIEEGGGRDGEKPGVSIESPHRIDINLVNPSELEQIPGVGPVIAQKIVLERERNGPFTCLEDLERVPNLGEKTIERMKPYLIFSPDTIRDDRRPSMPEEESHRPAGDAPAAERFHADDTGERAGMPDEGEADSELEEFRRWLKNLRK